MELIDRDTYLQVLSSHFAGVEQNGGGHSIFLTGEAGCGKTSLVNHFARIIGDRAIVLSGACDSLFTPRPLGPLYDVATQIDQGFLSLLKVERDRSVIFTYLTEKLSLFNKPVVLIFEDIHWADEATIDLIKFLARRIQKYTCLFLLTYRDNDLHINHPLISIFGDLPSGHFSKIPLKLFSQETVNQLAEQHGHSSGDELYNLTGGNPFYVMEVLKNKNCTIPEKVKDSVLSTFRAKDDTTRGLWEFLSIVPSRISLVIAQRVQQDSPADMDSCIASGVLIVRAGFISFKHELFRIAIEESLTPSRRKSLHKRMVNVLQEETVVPVDFSQLVHHAYYAEEWELVAKYAPRAAQEAAALGSHREAVKLLSMAIEYNTLQGAELAELYERHAYECYLTYNISQAIESQQKALALWQSTKVALKEGDAFRFLSRLWWFKADPQKAFALATQSIEVLENGFPTRERALAYSNLSQLCMLGDKADDALNWGNKAIDLATRMDDKDVLSHALNNVGCMLLKTPAWENIGEDNLKRSLAIALENGFHEHVARAYVNLASSFVYSRRYEKAMATFDPGLKYCEERDLDPWKYYMQNIKARALFETGKWVEAETLANRLRNNLNQPGIVSIDANVSLAKLLMRRGKFEEARTLVDECNALASPSREPQRIIPVVTAELEFAWITGAPVPLDKIKALVDGIFHRKNNSWHYTAYVYWLSKFNVMEQESMLGVEFNWPVRLELERNWSAAAEAWENFGCPYEQALALFNGNEDQKRKSIQILDSLGATATRDMLKMKLKLSGARSIPRGLRESTRKNPAQLTTRQIEILSLLEDGATYKEIADKLFISPKTVDHHISAVLLKLEVNSRSKAVIQARKLGIIK